MPTFDELQPWIDKLDTSCEEVAIKAGTKKQNVSAIATVPYKPVATLADRIMAELEGADSGRVMRCHAMTERGKVITSRLFHDDDHEEGGGAARTMTAALEGVGQVDSVAGALAMMALSYATVVDRQQTGIERLVLALEKPLAGLGQLWSGAETRRIEAEEETRNMWQDYMQLAMVASQMGERLEEEGQPQQGNALQEAAADLFRMLKEQMGGAMGKGGGMGGGWTPPKPDDA